ncbi:MAG: dihydrofolate reductase family protein [Acidobacteriota bacterium]|nr:dihydrofolate reductase family protein [Acidobacteriota bacterium]
MNRPFVYINMATTVDGKITSARREYPRFTSPLDREHMDRLRARADGLLVGAGTLRADNPRLDVRTQAMRDYRLKLGKPAGLHAIVVSGSAQLPTDSRFFHDDHGARRILVTTESTDPAALAALESRCEVWQLGEEQVDLGSVLRRLRDEGLESVLCEGGGELNARLIHEDLVDEINLTLAPTLLCGRDAPTIADGVGLTMADQRRLELIECRQEQDELYLRYRVVRDR